MVLISSVLWWSLCFPEEVASKQKSPFLPFTAMGLKKKYAILLAFIQPVAATRTFIAMAITEGLWGHLSAFYILWGTVWASTLPFGLENSQHSLEGRWKDVCWLGHPEACWAAPGAFPSGFGFCSLTGTVPRAQGGHSSLSLTHCQGLLLPPHAQRVSHSWGGCRDTSWPFLPPVTRQIPFFLHFQLFHSSVFPYITR